MAEKTANTILEYLPPTSRTVLESMLKEARKDEKSYRKWLGREDLLRGCPNYFVLFRMAAVYFRIK